MKKTTYEINFGFTFDPARKGAKYSFDGEHYMNAGDFKEAGDKAVKGYGFSKDANTPYDKGSDIAETHTSVKSSKATLVNKVLGYDFQSTKAHYFATVASDNWDWVEVIGEQLVIYNMDANEFSEFMDAWAGWDKERKVIRFKATSSKMMAWLEARV